MKQSVVSWSASFYCFQFVVMNMIHNNKKQTNKRKKKQNRLFLAVLPMFKKPAYSGLFWCRRCITEAASGRSVCRKVILSHSPSMHKGPLGASKSRKDKCKDNNSKHIFSVIPSHHQVIICVHICRNILFMIMYC